MSTQPKQTNVNVKVVCRFRPLNDKQKLQSHQTVHQLLDDKTVIIKDNTKTDKIAYIQPLKFTFDKVFDQNSTQNQVYTYAASSVVDGVIQGFNGTIFAYGQTASGKTHTMQGQISGRILQQSGIIPRMVVQIFDSISRCSENMEFRIKVSMVELYMEKLRDLINTNKNDLKIRSDKKKGIFIQNLTQVYISSPQQVYKLIQLARNTRAIASTNMNQRSSRSHLLFILTVSQNNTQQMSAKTGKLYLVDLAGSQKVGKTGAEGKVLDQAKKINVSLTALGKVINALTDGKSSHVPYRDSKLTRVLQQSLGGNSKTTLITTCSPHINNLSQTISTLRFGISAKKIKNKPQINRQLTVAQLQSLLDKTQKKLQQKQKYIQQLKNYITIDLKQKTIPSPQSQINKTLNNQHQDTDIVNQLQRQIQIQRNLNQVLELQLTSFKQKYQKIYNQKEFIEKQFNNSKNSISELQQTIKNLQAVKYPIRDLSIQSFSTAIQPNLLDDSQTLPIPITPPQPLDQLSDKKQKPTQSQTSQNYLKLLQNYQNEKLKNTKYEQTIQKNEKIMRKKLSQLQNNLSQLTHEYYNLLVIQQRYKFQNIGLKKKIQQKDTSIKSLKSKIKDLQDLNRDLQQQKWTDDYQQPIMQNKKSISKDQPMQNKKIAPKDASKFCISPQLSNKFTQFCAKRDFNKPTHSNTNVVKVVRGGNKQDGK